MEPLLQLFWVDRRARGERGDRRREEDEKREPDETEVGHGRESLTVRARERASSFKDRDDERRENEGRTVTGSSSHVSVRDRL